MEIRSQIISVYFFFSDSYSLRTKISYLHGKKLPPGGSHLRGLYGGILKVRGFTNWSIQNDKENCYLVCKGALQKRFEQTYQKVNWFWEKKKKKWKTKNKRCCNASEDMGNGAISYQSYTERLPFLSKMVCERVRVKTSGWSLPV